MKIPLDLLSAFIIIAMLSASGIVVANSGADLLSSIDPTAKPSPPQNVIVRPGPDYVDVSWKSPVSDGGSPITGYQIFIVQGEWVGSYPDTAPPVGRVGPDNQTYRHSGLTPLVTYIYYVKAENANGLSEMAGWEWAIPGKSIPAEPTLHAKVGNGTIWLSGTVPDPGGAEILGYRLYRGIQEGNLTLLVEIENWYGQDNFYYEDKPVTNGIKYYYLAYAYNIMGDEGLSRISVVPKPAPTSVTVFPRGVDNCGPVTILVNWSVPDGIMTNLTAFRIYGNRISGFVEVSPENRSYEAHVSGGWGYYFQIAALYDDGNESFADTVYVSSPMCEGGYDSGIWLIVVSMAAISGLVLAFAVVWHLRRKRH
jgi:hypothetical protein